MTEVAGRIGVVVVNYGSHALLEANLAPLAGESDVLVVVVDNWSSARERTALIALAEAEGWVTVLPDGNTGFGGGVNLGVRRALELGASALLMLNPDASIEPSAVAALAARVIAEPMTAVSPTILRSDGSTWFAGADLYVRNGRIRSPRRRDEHPGESFEPWLSGACLMVSAALWNRLGGFDEEYFLYWEDVDLSHRTLAAGGRLVVDPGVTAVHDAGGTQSAATAHPAAKSGIYYYYNVRNRLLFAARHLDRAARRRWLLTTIPAVREVLLRGGRRQFLHPVSPLGAALRGARDGATFLRAAARDEDPVRLDDAARTGRRARVYHTLRTAHLERAATLAPATIHYRRRSYDFDEDLARSSDLRPTPRLLSLLWALSRRPYDAVEINEPLMRPALAVSATAVAAATLRRLGGRSRPVLVSYAIENRDPFSEARAGGIRRRGRAVRDRLLSEVVARMLDRLAFGTSAAQQLYDALLHRELAATARTLVPALPSPCSCPSAAAQDPDHVVFLGALVERKGFPDVAAAWPEVVRRHPRAHLTILGKGRLEDSARQLAHDQPSVQLVLDPPRTQVHAVLRDASVLVLPSRPTQGWREQVGLPIVEGLAHGCAVLTTDQTGLADWLAAHGHAVVDPGLPSVDLAERIVGLVRARRSAASVLADLPIEDGRIAADRWLFAGD